MTPNSFLRTIWIFLVFSTYGCQDSDSKSMNEIQTNMATTADSGINGEIFWKIMERICGMGDFIAATGKEGASANIKGKFVIGFDGKEKVIENVHHDHIHLYP